MHFFEVDAIVPPSVNHHEHWPRTQPGLKWWVRGGLIFLVLFLVGGFSLAVYLDPYRDGKVWLEETHRQMNLPPCSFRVITGMPCPSCGMTSSFALFVRGDLWHSLQANAAGTLLAVFCLVLIPWGIASVWSGRLVWVREWDMALIRFLLLFLVVMFIRWGIVVAQHWGSS